MPAPTVSASVDATTRVVQATINCPQGNNIYYAYGLAGSANLPLQTIQSLIKTPVPDPLYYRQVGTVKTTKATDTKVQLTGIKNSGETYSLYAICEYLGANSTATSTTFTSWNNTNLKTLVIGITTTGTLTSVQKSIVAAAIAKALGTTKQVWTDEDKPFSASASNRILQSNVYNFYILPDYTSTAAAEDPDIAKYLKAASDSDFVGKVSTAAALPSITFTAATAASYPSTLPSPSLVTAYPAVTSTDTTLSMTLKQAGSAGSLYCAYQALTAVANNTQSVISETAYYALNLNATKLEALLNTDVQCNFSSLSSNTSYQLYYYGENTGLPKIRTSIYTQIATTTATASPSGLSILRFFSVIFMAIILIVLVEI
jgi:hypothetical protein